jgi:hypothetical protein
LATNAQMAVASGVSERTISDAKVVAAKATPEVNAAVKAGEMSVKEAAATTKPAKPTKAKPAGTTVATPRGRDDAPSAGALWAWAPVEKPNSAAAAELATAAQMATAAVLGGVGALGGFLTGKIYQ